MLTLQNLIVKDTESDSATWCSIFNLQLGIYCKSIDECG